jgi:hypothetical protein
MRKKNKRNLNQRPLGYRKKALAELKAKYPYYNLKSNLLGGLFLGGLILTIWETYIYGTTFIPLYVPLSIWFLTGLVMTPIFKKIFNIYCFNPYTPENTPMFFHYFYNIVHLAVFWFFYLCGQTNFFVTKQNRWRVFQLYLTDITQRKEIVVVLRMFI